MRHPGYRAWQVIVLVLLGAAMVVSLMLPESLLNPPAPERVEVSVLMRRSDTAAGTTIRQGMEQAAQDLNVELRFLAPQEDNDSGQQLQLLQSQEAMVVNAAVIIPANAGELEALLSRWQTLPVVTLESRVEGAAAFVGPEDDLVGRLLAEQVLRDCLPGQRVLLADSDPGWEGPARRQETARTALEEAGFAPETVAQVTAETLEGAGAVLCFDPLTLDQTAALAKDCQDPPKVYGTGVSDQVVARLEEGEIRAIVAWSDYATGYLGVTQAVAAARGETAEDRILPSVLVQEGETHDKDHEKLLYPAVG